MHGTTRELNFATITFVSVMFVLLLVVIVAASTAWFRYEFEQQRQQRIAQYGQSLDLLSSNQQEQDRLAGTETGIDIDAAMQQVAERY